MGIFLYLLHKKQYRWELFPKINKHVVPNNAVEVGKNPKKRIKNVTLLLGASEYEDGTKWKIPSEM